MSRSEEAQLQTSTAYRTDLSCEAHDAGTRATKTLQKPIQNCADLPKLPKFYPLQPVVPPHKAWNRLRISFSELDAITPIQIFNLFLTNSIIGQLVAHTNSYAQQQLLGPEKEQQHSCQPVTAQDLYLWLAIQIHMGLIGVPPERYWMKDGVYLPKDGLPPAAYLGKTCFQEIRHFFHIVIYNSPTETPKGLQCLHSKVDILLEQLRFFSQQYRVPGSNVTIGEVMILFTGRSIYITKMPNKPISQGYKFFFMAGKGYVWEFHPSSNAVGGDPVDVDSRLLQLTDTGMMVHHLIRRLHQRHRKRSFNVYMHNFVTTQPQLAEVRRMGINAWGTCRLHFPGCPKELNVGKNAKLPYQSGAVNHGVATLLWMDSSPVTMMSTIHPLSGEDSQVLRMRKHPGNKSTNASGANSTFLPGECQKELDIPVIVDPFNQHKVGVDVADQYWTDFDTQLISRCNWYPLFYCILETAVITSLILYWDLPATKEHTVDHFDFHLSIVHDLLQAWSPSTLKSSSCILASQNITRSAPHTICHAPTAYQASYEANPLAPLPKGTRNAFSALDGESSRLFSLQVEKKSGWQWRRHENQHKVWGLQWGFMFHTQTKLFSWISPYLEYFYLILGHLARLWLWDVYFKSWPICGHKPGYRQRDSPPPRVSTWPISLLTQKATSS